MPNQLISNIVVCPFSGRDLDGNHVFDEYRENHLHDDEL